MNTADRFIKFWLSTIIIAVTVIASCSMLLQVIARYVFEISISGLDELTGHMAVWMYLMGAAYGSFERSQIKAEMIHLFIKNDRALNSIRAFATAIAAVVAGYMTVWSYGYVKWSIVKHEVTPTLQIPTVVFQIAILIGALLMVAYFLREAIDLTLRAYRSLPADTE
jgi:TRAP-type C4-dicarboxylate transport system permease small subunit